MEPQAPARKRVSATFLVALIIGAGLAVCAAIIPWLDCPTCHGIGGGGGLPEGVLRCPSCRDRGKTSLVLRTTLDPVDPDVASFSRTWPAGQDEEQGPPMERLFRKNGLDPGRTLLYDSKAFDWIDQGFVESGSTHLLLLALSCNEGSFGLKRPTPFPGRLYLFNLQGWLVDSLEIADAHGRAGVRLQMVYDNKVGDPLFEVRAFLRSELSRGPSDVDVTHRGKTRRLLSGFTAGPDAHESRTVGRIFVRNGALELRE